MLGRAAGLVADGMIELTISNSEQRLLRASLPVHNVKVNKTLGLSSKNEIKMSQYSFVLQLEYCMSW